MRNKDKSTYRKIEFRRKESFYLLVRGLEVGIVSGLIAVLYRFLLSLAENYLMKIISYVKGNPVKIAVWFVILALIGFFVSMLVKWEPQGGGSGIPQVSGEIKGHINPSWWRVILVKLIGGTASVFSGLSLGREGPSVQLGGMAAKGIARLTKADKTTELRMISCGAGAGMAAAFNAPLAGTMFVLEEIHHTFDKSLLCMGIVSAVTADYISKLFFGQNTVFNYDTVNFPLKYYWLLLIMGVFLGLCGSAYNVVMGKAQDLYKKIKAPNYIKMPIIFVFSGVVGLIMPQILCGGHSMEVILLKENPSLLYLVVLLSTKFLFGAVCFASGAPGGTMGLVGNMDIIDNMMLRSYKKGNSAFLDRKDPKKLAEKIIESLEVVTPGATTPVRRLSGGNVQKVLVGREIAANPKVLMAAYPVRGLDINSSYMIYNLLTKQKENGVAVVFVGEDLDVLVELCDRIMVINSGKITGMLDGRNTTKEEIGLLMTKTEAREEA